MAKVTWNIGVKPGLEAKSMCPKLLFFPLHCLDIYKFSLSHQALMCRNIHLSQGYSENYRMSYK